MNKIAIVIILSLLVIGGLGLIFTQSQTLIPSHTSKIQIVAAENFYGDIAKQLGGNYVQVTSLLSDPNVDPHEYESNVQDAIALSHANIVIENGDGYDTWMDKLLSASPNKGRIVLVGATIASHKIVDNPHVWYGIDNMSEIAATITENLKKIDPQHTAEYTKNLSDFDNSLQPIWQKMADIQSQFNQTPVALTETILRYQTQPMGLTVVTPLSFEQAIAEGNDPSAQAVATTNDQILKKQVKVLIYNQQTVTPITTNLQNEAKQNNIPVIAVTETMPTNDHYQSWMLSQLDALQKALVSGTQK